MADVKPVSHDEADQIAQRFIDYFFGNKAETPRVSIPARPDYDDDLRLTAYIEQQRSAARSLIDQEGKANERA